VARGEGERRENGRSVEQSEHNIYRLSSPTYMGRDNKILNLTIFLQSLEYP
jgi:hypothetical protein